MNYDASKPDGYPHFCTKNKNNQPQNKPEIQDPKKANNLFNMFGDNLALLNIF